MNRKERDQFVIKYLRDALTAASVDLPLHLQIGLSESEKIILQNKIDEKIEDLFESELAIEHEEVTEYFEEEDSEAFDADFEEVEEGSDDEEASEEAPEDDDDDGEYVDAEKVKLFGGRR